MSLQRQKKKDLKDSPKPPKSQPNTHHHRFHSPAGAGTSDDGGTVAALQNSAPPWLSPLRCGDLHGLLRSSLSLLFSHPFQFI